MVELYVRSQSPSKFCLSCLGTPCMYSGLMPAQTSLLIHPLQLYLFLFGFLQETSTGLCFNICLMMMDDNIFFSHFCLCQLLFISPHNSSFIWSIFPQAFYNLFSLFFRVTIFIYKLSRVYLKLTWLGLIFSVTQLPNI